MNFKTALFSLLLLTISMHLLDAADCKTSLPIAQAHIGACVIRECKQNEKCICDIQNGLCHQYCSANYCPLIKCTAPQGCEQNSRINTIKTLEADSDIVKQRCHGGTICEDVICRAKENCTSQCVTGASCNTMTCDSKYCKLTCLEASNCGSMICSRAQCDMECDKSARCGSMICKKGVEQCNMLVRERSNSPVKMECSSDRCNMTCDRHSVCEHMECLPGVKECNMFVRNSNKVKAKSPGDRVRMICHSGNCTLRCETGSFCEWMECKRGVERCNMTCDDQTECYMRCGAKNCGFNCGPQSTCKVKKVLNDENDGKSLHEHMLFLLITFVFLSMMIAHR